MKSSNFVCTIFAALIVMTLILSAYTGREIRELADEINELTLEIKTLQLEIEELSDDILEVDNSIVGIRKNVDLIVMPDEVEDDGRLPGDDVEAQWPRLYSDEDAAAFAKLVWGEGRGIPDNGIVSGRCQQAAIMWVVLNRYDAGYGDSIMEVLTAPNQFVGYSDSNPVDPDLLELAYDVLDRWNREKHDETMVGRVIPADYFWFRGDGTYNYFRNDYNGNEHWAWELRDPYGIR